MRRGGVGRVSGRSLDAAFKMAMDGSRDGMAEVGAREGECEAVGKGGVVTGREGGWDWTARRWIASDEAFSRMDVRSAPVRPGMASQMSMRRTSVGRPWCFVRRSSLTLVD